MNLAIHLALPAGKSLKRAPTGTNKRMSVTSDDDAVVTVSQSEWSLPSTNDHPGSQNMVGHRASIQEWMGHQLAHVSVQKVINVIGCGDLA